jgi:deferrochelatase/peroxidase EfeB
MPDAAQGTSRRRFLAGALGTAGVAAAGAGFGAGFGTARATTDDGTPTPHPAAAEVPFYAVHQAGIDTAAQDRLAFAAFDVTSTDRDDLQVLLASWAAAAAQMTQGEHIGADDIDPTRPPLDTGEAVGLPASQLTITVGFGPSLFDDRFGFRDKRPKALEPLPQIPGDADLQEEISHGDLCVQACANDPVVAFHAIRNFARIARGTAVMRWSQLGFGRTSSTTHAQATPRNLMGFKDGTNNLKAEDTAEMAKFVWVGDEADQTWMRGGTYLVSRRIRMLIESWDTDDLDDQQAVFGRFKTSGAPLTGKAEFDTVDLGAKTADGKDVVDLNAHIRLAAPSQNDGIKLLRRGYSYTDGIDQRTGYLDAGLFFIAFCRNAHEQFVPVQSRLGQHDRLNEYIVHTSSGLFAVPRGLTGPGDYWGKDLFA